MKAIRARAAPGPRSARCATHPISVSIRYNVFGAVRPKDGRLGALLFNLCDSVTFQVFLDTLAEENPRVEGRRAILVLDNASWHKTKSLNWHHFEPEYLPPRSPDLNAIERLWLRMKADWFNGWIAKTSEQLQDRIIESLRSLFDQPSILRSVPPKDAFMTFFLRIGLWADHHPEAADGLSRTFVTRSGHCRRCRTSGTVAKN
ncbi:MAG: transposase [Verrucomicrobiaceae bacterium]|nr:transposase [Verrucomicrobiaceae bacterium]